MFADPIKVVGVLFMVILAVIYTWELIKIIRGQAVKNNAVMKGFNYIEWVPELLFTIFVFNAWLGRFVMDFSINVGAGVTAFIIGNLLVVYLNYLCFRNRTVYHITGVSIEDMECILCYTLNKYGVEYEMEKLLEDWRRNIRIKDCNAFIKIRESFSGARKLKMTFCRVNKLNNYKEILNHISEQLSQYPKEYSYKSRAYDVFLLTVAIGLQMLIILPAVLI